MALQIDGQTPVAVVEDPAPGRASLLGVEAVGDRHVHDARRPVRPDEAGPVGPLAYPANAARQALPERFAHGATPSAWASKPLPPTPSPQRRGGEEKACESCSPSPLRGGCGGEGFSVRSSRTPR